MLCCCFARSVRKPKLPRLCPLLINANYLSCSQHTEPPCIIIIRPLCNSPDTTVKDVSFPRRFWHGKQMIVCEQTRVRAVVLVSCFIKVSPGSLAFNVQQKSAYVTVSSGPGLRRIRYCTIQTNIWISSSGHYILLSTNVSPTYSSVLLQGNVGFFRAKAHLNRWAKCWLIIKYNHQKSLFICLFDLKPGGKCYETTGVAKRTALYNSSLQWSYGFKVSRAGLKPMQLHCAPHLWWPRPVHWCLGRLFIFSRYPLRSIIQ